MKFFIDTANIEEIREVATWGVVDGVTTNPSLVAKAARRPEEIYRDIVEIVNGPISAEVISTDYQGMIQEGEKLAAIHPNIVVKIPLTLDGIKALKYFTKNSIKTNVTLVFSANQALLAAKNGATYVSPFIGRLDDIGENGLGLISNLVKMYKHYNFQTQILAASIRGPLHVEECASRGADVATIPFKVLKQLFHHPLTDRGLEQFLSDYHKANL